MAKYRKPISDNQLINDGLVPAIEEQYNTKRVFVVSCTPAHSRIRGQVTGELYEWTQAGQEVSVDEQDLPQLLERKLGGSCCGSSARPVKLFKLKE
jgi:hypothetical protein